MKGVPPPPTVEGRRCWHSEEREGPRLKDTRTNNQLQILFTHHLGSPNYPPKLHKEHHYHFSPVHVHTVCECVHVCSMCLLKGDSLADPLFACSPLIAVVVCQMLWPLFFFSPALHFSLLSGAQIVPSVVLQKCYEQLLSYLLQMALCQSSKQRCLTKCSTQSVFYDSKPQPQHSITH